MTSCAATCPVWKRRVFLAGCLLAAGALQAQIVGQTNYFVTSSGDWADATNWDQPAAPVTDAGAKIYSKSGATITLTTEATIGYLALNDGDASTLSVAIDGGTLISAAGNWNAIGYNKSSSLLITSGGSWECDGRIDVGLLDDTNGMVAEFTMDATSGDVSVNGDFSVGRSFDGSHTNITTRAYVHGGTLYVGGNLEVAAIGDNLLDVSGNAAVIIDGNEATAVQGMILDGRVTAYGGAGTPIVDYNGTYPGKTTITAYAGTLNPDWQVVSPAYPASEVIVTPYDALADFGIVADGTTDVTGEIQQALIVIANLGGGSLFLPEGFYKVAGNLTIPPSVTLRGDWQQPVAGQPVVGTVLMAYAGRDDENAQSFITLSPSAGVNGVAVWYPEQLPTDIRPYPITFSNGGAATIENITFVNAYFGYSSYRDGTTGRPFVRHVYGTPLKTGIEFDCIADIGRIESVHFSPDFWAGSGLANAPVAGEHEAWLYANGTGVIHRRMDWSYSCYVKVEGYNIGLALRPSRWDGKAPNGQSYDFDLTDCQTGIFIEKNLYNGSQFTRFTIQGAEVGVHMGPDTAETSLFHTCEIEASEAAFINQGSTARAMVTSCDFQGAPVRVFNGYLSVIDSDFSGPGAHIILDVGARGTAILGNRFAGGPRIIDNTDYPVEIDHTPLALDPLPAYDYKKPAAAYQPAKDDLFVVTDAPFNAAADGVADDTAAFAAALAAAAANSGGIVFVPAGNYRLDGSLTVPAGVELRGVFDIPHGTDTKGSLLNVYSGRTVVDGTPFLQLEANSGIRGLNFHYPEQVYDDSDPVDLGFVPYPFMIRGLGPDVYVINISATLPYQLLDLATYACDNHYVDYIFSTCLKTGIHVGGGTTGGQLQNIQFNPNSYTFRWREYDSIPQGTAGNVHLYMKREATPYLFGDMTGQVVHECFVFSGARGMHLVNEGGSGPSGHCLGQGVDAAIHAFQIDAVGAGDFAPINSQIVATDGVQGRYLVTGAGLTDTFRMFSSAGWGGHEYSAVLDGGDVRLQNFHLARDGESGAFVVNNTATLESYAGTLDDFLAAGRPFLTIDPTASAAFYGNIINTTDAQMPDDGDPNVTAVGNLQYNDAPTGASSGWTNGGGDRDWTNGSNWAGGLPSGGVRAGITEPVIDGAIVSPGPDALAKSLVLDDTLDVAGGSLLITDWLVIGHDEGNSGSFTMTGGSVSVGTVLLVGMDGGGDVALDDGSLEVGALVMTGGGLLDITGGMLVVAGDVTATIAEYVSNGWVTAHGGSFAVAVDYGITTPGKTTVVAGEPAVTTTVWNPGAGSNLWTADASWTAGAAPLDRSQNLKVVFNVEGAQECVLDAPATVAQLSVGDNQTSNGTYLRLVAGADLTAGITLGGATTWTAIGYNRPAQVTVESGAVLRAASYMLLGYTDTQESLLAIEGGEVHVSTTLNLGNAGDTARGRIHVDGGGLLTAGALVFNNANSVVDLRDGTIVLDGDDLAAVNGFISAENIIAYGGAGTVTANYNVTHPGKTTVSIVPDGYVSWAQGYGEYIGPPDDDHDGDDETNLNEYGSNGNPIDASIRGVPPAIERAGGAIEFRHLMRNDDPDLVYTVETCDNLLLGNWVGAGFSATGTAPAGAAYDEVTYEVPMGEDQLFIRLQISRN